MDDNRKLVSVVGTHHRYMIKKANNHKKKDTIRSRYQDFEETIDVSFIKTLIENNENDISLNNHQDYIIKEIKYKINSYLSQDKKHNRYDYTTFISLHEVLQKLISCELKCYYCKNHLMINYKVSREKKQWTLERKNNNIQHNNDNCLVACLECNLKRRNSNYDAFYMSKNMKIIKGDQMI